LNESLKVQKLFYWAPIL